MSVEQAQQVLKDAGFNPVLGGYRDSPNPLDTVAFTSPAAGSQAGSGDTITIYQSTGHVAPPPQQHTGGGGGGGGGWRRRRWRRWRRRRQARPRPRRRALTRRAQP